MGENRVVADQMGEVRVWATNGEHRSHKTKSRARFVLGRAPEALPIHLQDKTTLDDVISDMDDFMGR